MHLVKFSSTTVAYLVVFGSVASARDAHSMENRQHDAEKQDHQPGLEKDMVVKPLPYSPFYKPAGKLLGKVALITGGDSGIGRSVAIHYCLEGADVAIACMPEEMGDAKETQRLCQADVNTLVREMIKLNPESERDFLEEAKTVKKYGKSRVIILTGDIGDPQVAQRHVDETVKQLGKLNILVNNAGEQHKNDDFNDISNDQLQKTFATNIFRMFYLSQAAVKHMDRSDVIINTASIAAHTGSKGSVDYAATKGAIVSFTRSLSGNLVEKGIRVNAVAPGPIWTPLVPASYQTKEKAAKHGIDTPMKRPGETCELGPAYVFLASFDSNYITGQTIHINGGTILNG